MAQNTSHAVMAQRHENARSPDDFPTPPFATRALIRHAIGTSHLATKMCAEPACGVGHMVRPLAETFRGVIGTDKFDYGTGMYGLFDFAAPHTPPAQLVRDYVAMTNTRPEWVITNPPFNRAEQFVRNGLALATEGVAMLARTSFIESVGRYERIFSLFPPTIVAPFSERVPMFKGRLSRKGSTATSYAWFIWHKQRDAWATTKLVIIPPCRKMLEKPGDYPD